MRFANVGGRACVGHGGQWFDVATASGGQFGPDVQGVYQRWPDLLRWYRTDFDPRHREPCTGVRGAPVPEPSQVFGIGLNYADHARAAALPFPVTPLVFPKFSSCIAGPDDVLALDSDTVDWEVELVAVVGRTCRNVPAAQAWSVIAGLTVGQDVSDRELQFANAGTSQFGLGKSKPGYGPVGPEVVTVDELDDPSALSIRCSVNGDTVQQSNTRELIFDVPTLVAYLSGLVTLRAGDLIFTGTPHGVGMTHTPARYLGDGDVIVSEIDGIGRLVTRAANTKVA